MIEKNYSIFINTKIQNRVVNITNCTLDEAVSIAIVFFDKFSTRVGDYVSVINFVSEISDYKVQRTIILKEGLKVEIQL